MFRKREELIPELLQAQTYVDQLREGEVTWRDYYLDRVLTEQQGINDAVAAGLRYQVTRGMRDRV